MTGRESRAGHFLCGWGVASDIYVCAGRRAMLSTWEVLRSTCWISEWVGKLSKWVSKEKKWKFKNECWFSDFLKDYWCLTLTQLFHLYRTLNGDKQWTWNNFISLCLTFLNLQIGNSNFYLLFNFFYAFPFLIALNLCCYMVCIFVTFLDLL